VTGMLPGKVVLITGSGTGRGAATVNTSSTGGLVAR
jgi:NAD(P)-dependent dehydrogenase (short-subunit alcohol dehydrogenase family)